MKRGVFSFATPGFIHGIAKTIDIKGFNKKDITLGTFGDDAESIYNDWCLIGNDIKKAMKLYGRESKKFKAY